MKKPIVSLTSAFFLLVVSYNCHAQFTAKADKIAIADLSSFTVTGTPVEATKINLKAMKNFQNSYPHVTDAQWSVLKDKSQLCVFQLSEVKYRAFYNPNGSWSYSVLSYDGKQIKRDLYEKIHATYYDYRIVYVNQIDLSNGKTIYLVEIQDDKSIKKIRVSDEDEMDIISDYAK